jgi:TPR repeat protein
MEVAAFFRLPSREGAKPNKQILRTEAVMTSRIASMVWGWGVLAGMLVVSASSSRAQNLPNSAVEASIVAETALVVGPGKSLKDARKTFEMEARQGYAAAQLNLAVCYLNGWGAEKNYGAALYWLKEAAKQGQARAYTNLGLVYLNGWGVARDYEEALKNFRRAAEHGETGAMVNVGYMAENGMGTARNQAEAAEWYMRAADRGDALGQNNLADLYLRGLGVPQSDVKAAEWFQQAANQGQAAARIKLGFLYMTGRGVAEDRVAAYGWILAASKAGDHRGDEYLTALSAELNAEQHEAATRQASELQQARPVRSTATAQVR